jgi:hypothetical protein
MRPRRHDPGHDRFYQNRTFGGPVKWGLTSRIGLRKGWSMPIILSDISINPRRIVTSTAAPLALAFMVLAGALWPSPSHAGPLNASAIGAPIIAVDWQGPLSLPPRFRNHCRYDADHGAWYCADHCGIDDQFYFCSPASFGCCRINYGYCDWKGRLRCAP